MASAQNRHGYSNVVPGSAGVMSIHEDDRRPVRPRRANSDMEEKEMVPPPPNISDVP